MKKYISLVLALMLGLCVMTSCKKPTTDSSTAGGGSSTDGGAKIELLDLGEEFNERYYPDVESIPELEGGIDVVILFDGTQDGWRAVADEYMRLHGGTVVVNLNTNYTDSTYSDKVMAEVKDPNTKWDIIQGNLVGTTVEQYCLNMASSVYSKNAYAGKNILWKDVLESDAYITDKSGANTDCFIMNSESLNTAWFINTVALAFSDSLNGVIGEMTKYRRYIAGKSPADENLPAIFNEYMHLSWDTPSEAQTRKIAPIVSKTGVEYYVIDCGWHDECETWEIYHYVGQWNESKKRFPSGIRATTDYIRSLGLKAGLWIEPEVIGIKCAEMLGFYDDDCFIQRNGKRVAVMNRYFLDYRSEKVRTYMSEVIRRMVEDYGADYIKCDYNQDCGVGTDYAAFSAGAGLEAASRAFLDWMQQMIDKFPQVVFEGCASGGMRMDYKTLSVYSLLSTSDQVDYLQYPYIAGNVLSAVIPEQAAVWSYPVGEIANGLAEREAITAVQSQLTKERISVNMINSFLGRIHLASHLELINDEQFALVQEGVQYYKTLVKAKKTALPYLPCGLTEFGAENVVAGFKTDKKIYLAVWCLKGEKTVNVPIAEGIKAAKLAYPSVTDTTFSCKNKQLTVNFAKDKNAAFFELEI